MQFLSAARMSETTSESSATVQRKVVTVAAVFAGLIVVAAVALWAHYGAAVFYEVILAGLNACF
jgi:predicted secreted protein